MARSRITDLSPKMRIHSAESELSLPFGSGGQMAPNTGGINMFQNALRRGQGDHVWGVDEHGLWLGKADFEGAPLRIDYDGHITAVDADFSAAGYTKLKIFKQTSIPVSESIGDLWFDTDDGNKMYRAGSVGADAITTGEWEAVSTTGLSVFAQDGIPTSTAIGDLWYDTNDNNKVYRAASVGADAVTAGEWVIVNDLRAADAVLKSGAGQTLTGDIQVGGANVKIDGANARILINDGSDDRILIGFQSGGF